ncbi:phosphoadenosine phosphosulfate reductase family protein [Sphingomonas sp. 22L2VL55-3]
MRWCSPALKIDVLAAAIRNQPRFLDGHTLVITGERAEESPSRARYATLEPHRTSTLAHAVDHWRPVHDWTERLIWDAISQARTSPHPAYVLGWDRLSCRACIFGSPDQWATLRLVFLPPSEGLRLAKPRAGRRSIARSPSRNSLTTVRRSRLRRSIPTNWRKPMIGSGVSRSWRITGRSLTAPSATMQARHERRHALRSHGPARSHARRPVVGSREIGMALLRHGQRPLRLPPREQAPHGLAARIRCSVSFSRSSRQDAMTAAIVQPVVQSVCGLSPNRPFEPTARFPFFHVWDAISGKLNREQILGKRLLRG